MPLSLSRPTASFSDVSAARAFRLTMSNARRREPTRLSMSALMSITINSRASQKNESSLRSAQCIMSLAAPGRGRDWAIGGEAGCRCRRCRFGADLILALEWPPEIRHHGQVQEVHGDQRLYRGIAFAHPASR